jgi:ABC-type methionine transport system ATPase subunit
VLSAQLETVSGESKGQMVLQLPENEQKAALAMRVLQDKGVRVEEVNG